jgi:sodium/pantothenate symporter
MEFITQNAALITFALYTSIVFVIAGFSNQILQSKKSFLSEYFLGSRGLGMWAFALTFAATSASGGTFTGFPSKIYSHGWILALWIASYMVFPVTTMVLLGKRLNHVARIAGSITVPDVLRDRFHSRNFGLVAVLLIVFFLTFNLVAQFKAGSLILLTLLGEVTVMDQFSNFAFGSLTTAGGMLEGIDPRYLVCLFGFGVAVIFYTTYGGFHAVVWTDVMQGFVMVAGVLIMLPLALMQVGKMAPDGMGSLEYATREMAKMTPPLRGTATLELPSPASSDQIFGVNTWIVQRGSVAAEAGSEGATAASSPDAGEAAQGGSVTSEATRLFRLVAPVLVPAGASSVPSVKILEITTPGDIERQLAQLAASAPQTELRLSQIETVPYAYGSSPEQRGAYVSGPAPHPTESLGFLPLSLAISFFFMWAISGAGQPSNMVRLMAFRNARTLRYAVVTVSIYFSTIYLPLILIFCMSRLLMPGMEADSDRIMPEIASKLSRDAGMSWLAGILIAAPFAAVMSTVDSFLLMISSAIVRDVYQRNIHPEASENRIKWLTYISTLVVGVAVMVAAINPPQFLQDIIVYVGSGLAAGFLAPVVYMLYWPRSNRQGCMGAMLAGFAAHLGLYMAGIFVHGSFFRPMQILNFDPIIIGLFVSFFAGFVITLLTPPPPPELVRKYFYANAEATK